MPYELIHFRGSEKILKEKKLKKDLLETLEYLDAVLFEAPNWGELLKQALQDLGWRESERALCRATRLGRAVISRAVRVQL